MASIIIQIIRFFFKSNNGCSLNLPIFSEIKSDNLQRANFSNKLSSTSRKFHPHIKDPGKSKYLV